MFKDTYFGDWEDLQFEFQLFWTLDYDSPAYAHWHTRPPTPHTHAHHEDPRDRNLDAHAVAV